jgi:O-antigen/teichoic acid export membrane protein
MLKGRMFKELFRHSIIYGIGSAMQNAAGFVLLPLYAQYLTVSEYGKLEIFIVSITILLNLLQLGLGSALFKYYSYEGSQKKNYDQNKLIISSSFYFLIVFGSIVIFACYLFRKPISIMLFESGNYSYLFSIMLVVVFFRLFSILPISYLRIQNKSVLFSVLNFSQFIIQIGLIIYMVIVLQQKIYGVLIAKAITSGIFSGLFMWVISSQFVSRFSFSVVRELLSYSIYLVPVSIGSLILMMSNRYFILIYLNSEQLGIFSVANRIGTLILLAVLSFQMAWPSIMFRIKEKANAKQYYSRVFTYFVFLFSFLTVGLTLFSGELILLLANRNYISAVSIIPILGISYVFYGLFYVGTVGIHIYKKTYYQTIAMIIGTFVNLLLNFILIPLFGIMGASMALCLSFGFYSNSTLWNNGCFDGFMPLFWHCRHSGIFLCPKSVLYTYRMEKNWQVYF